MRIEPTVGSETRDDWRMQVLRAILRALAIIGVIALLGTTPVLVVEGQVLLSVAYWALMAPFLWVAFSRKLGFRVRLASMLVACYAVAVAIGIGERRVPELAVYLTAISAMAALLGGVRWGTIWLAICGLTLVAIAAANVSGALGPAPPSAIDPTSAGNWITLGLNWALFAVSLSLSIWVVIAHLERSLGRERVLAQELRDHVQRVEHASAAQREAEAQLVRAQKLEVVGTLASGFAHDFNNLLTAITLGTDSALRASTSSPRIEQSLQTVQDAALQASRLTSQLLSFSRHAIIDPRRWELGELVRRSQRIIERLLPPDTHLALELASEPVVVTIDQIQFQQVLLNLIVNARDAIGDSAGTITIRTRVDEIEREQVAVLEVEDTGTGIDDAIRSRIFEPFFTTKPSGRGTGLGLSITATIVEQGGGVIRVSSEHGRGSTFTVQLPRCEGPAELEQASVMERSGRGERILVVDDDLAVRAVLCAALREAGYEVHDAASASAAMALFHQHSGRFQLILTDVLMPEGSGTELAQAIHGVAPHARILFCSAYADDEQLRTSVSQRAVALLQKPFTRAELLAKVRGVLEAEH